MSLLKWTSGSKIPINLIEAFLSEKWWQKVPPLFKNGALFIPLLNSGGKKLYHIDFFPFCLRNFYQIMLVKILLEVNRKIRIRDISAFLMRSNQGRSPLPLRSAQNGHPLDVLRPLKPLIFP
jgi:hypothetical protein